MAQVILFVRHAVTDYHPGRLAGWTPGVNLSEAGRLQAKQLGERLAPVPLAAVYSSPLERCRQTAEAILEGRKLQMRIDEGLGEVRYGSWQGKPYKVLAKTDIWRKVQTVPSQAAFPGGETVRELQHRAVEAAERVRSAHRKGVVAVVSHADTIKVIAAHYLGMHLDLFQRIVIGNASVTAFAFGDGFPRLLRLSDTGAYPELVPRRPKAKKR
jgi:probable phosphoglycerate mutase